MPSGTGGMGTGTDVRIYSPRSESSTMFRNNDGDDSYNPSDPRFVDAEIERKQRKKEAEEKRRGKLKHIKIKVGNKMTGETGYNPKSEGIDDSEKIDADREIHAQTGPAGSRGYLTSLAAQAKGPGATRGEMVAMGEPMKVGVLLLKRERHAPGFVRVEHRGKKKPKGKKAKKVDIEHRKKWRPSTGAFKKPPGGMSGGIGSTIRRFKARMRGIKSGKKTGLMEAPLAVEMSHRGIKTKQPMSKEPRRYRQYLGQQEARQRLGNVRTVASAPPRFGARSYTAGPTGAGTLQALLPGVSQVANPVGVQKPGVGIGNLKPRLIPHRSPPIVPSPGLTRPSLVKPSAPSMPSMGSQMTPPSVGVTPQMRQNPMSTPLPSSNVQMSEDKIEGSDILKRSPFNYSEMTELRQLLHAAKRALKRKERQRKGKGDKDAGGAGSNLPKHPANGPKQTNRNEGATHDAKNDPRTFGLDPISYISGKGGRTP